MFLVFSRFTACRELCSVWAGARFSVSALDKKRFVTAGLVHDGDSKVLRGHVERDMAYLNEPTNVCNAYTGDHLNCFLFALLNNLNVFLLGSFIVNFLVY